MGLNFMRLFPVTSVRWELKPLFDPDHAASLLASPFTAVAEVNRAGVRRRDIIKLNPMFAFPKPATAADAKAA